MSSREYEVSSNIDKMICNKDKIKVMVVAQKVDENDDILGFFYGWLNELAKKIDKIYVLTLESKDRGLPKNVELYSLGKEKGNNRLKRFLKFNQALMTLSIRKKIDIIFIHMCPEYAILTWPYARLKNIPIIMWYAHGDVNIHLRIASSLVNRVVSSSQDGFRINSRKLTIVGQGIDVNKFKPQASSPKPHKEEKIVLSIGRISPIKSYEVFIKAADILVNQNNIRDLKFQIVGGVPLKSQNRYLLFLKHMASEYNLENHVQFIGPVPYTQIHNYYQNCDLFVSTSNTGSLDKAVLEAMACGKLVLTCNEAFKDVLGSQAKNLMFEKGNATELAKKISSIFRMDEKSQQELGMDLRNFVIEKHSLNKLIDSFRSIFYAYV